MSLGNGQQPCLVLRCPANLRFRFVPLAFFLCLVMVGCGGRRSEENLNPESKLNLVRIGGAYARATAELRHPPNNLNELSPYLSNGQTDAASLLRSPEDGEEYVIVWGVDSSKFAPPLPVLAYEKTGKAGKRHVLTLPSRVSVMTETEFRKAPFPPGHQPST